MKLSAFLLTLVVSSLASLPSPAASRAITMAVGWNGIPGAGTSGQGLEPLHFADDDALAVQQLGSQLGQSILLTAFDRDTERRVPTTTIAVPPTLANLKQTVAQVRTQLLADPPGALQSTIIFYYSGHGSVDAQGTASFTFADGQLTQRDLYEDVLKPLALAGTVHVIVDACHAEAVVRPRDGQAASVATPEAHVDGFLNERTLARFANVGVVMSSTSAAQSHEWDTYQSGIFTHELLSALRGAADVNGDRRIDYGELAAFLSAANRGVRDPRARLRPVVVPPRSNPRAFVVDLNAAFEGGGNLHGAAALFGPLCIEDESGNRLLDFNSEPTFEVELLVPAGSRLFLRARGGEAQFALSPGEDRDFSDLNLSKQEMRSRGALAMALERGLFATEFGPRYFQGFVDHWEEGEPVAVKAARTESSDRQPGSSRRAWTTVAFATAGASALASATFGIMSWQARNDLDSAKYERQFTSAANRYETYGNLAWITLSGAILSGIIGAWLWQDAHTP